MTPDERGLAVAGLLHSLLPDVGRRVAEYAAEMVAAAVAAERGRWAELLAAAVDAVETFEAGGMPGGPVLRLREAARRVREGGA